MKYEGIQSYIVTMRNNTRECNTMIVWDET